MRVNGFMWMLIILFAMVGTVKAQLVEKNSSVEKNQSDLDWYNCSFEKDGVYGAEVNRAYEFLKGKRVKKRPIVALIGGGMDVEHEDIKGAIWVNRKEKANGKDNDRNGYAGDRHGWNFLGGKDGRVMDFTLDEGDREFLRLKEQYGGIFYDGQVYFTFREGKKVIFPVLTNKEDYAYYRNQVLPETSLGGSYEGAVFAYVIREYGEKYDREMRARFPGKELTTKEFSSCYDPQAPRDSIGEIAFTFINMAFSVYKTDKWDVVYEKYVKNTMYAQEIYEQNFKIMGSDGRSDIVGDNYLDIRDTRYGNNVLLTSNAAAGVMQAGIIAGKRGNGLGGDGIADAQIMTLRVAGNSGEPYLKDIALAMRYAVDHGADILVLPQQNTLYPPAQKGWIKDALLYAESKGALVIVPAWELSDDLSEKTYYPNRWMAGDRELGNLIVVSSSDKEGNPSMNANYGAKELDLFAPGISIYSSYTGDIYKSGTGVGLASASVAGVAALIKSYYPNLNGNQIRKLLIENVTSRKGVEVEKGIQVDGKESQDLFLFEELSLSGGILNAYQAIVAAEAWTNKR